MKTSSKNRPLSWICNQYKKGNISFKHKLQRPIGQWNTKMKSLLIHSLLVGIPVNPIYVVEEDNIIYTLDGSQRTSICIAYINNEFPLSKDTPNVTLSSVVDGEKVSTTYEIAGKKFKDLDEEIQQTLKDSCTLEFCTISEYTEDEVREMFRRQNSGKPLNNKLLRIVHESDELSDAIYDLSTTPFMDKLLSNTQRKNGTDRDLIIQTLMLISTNQTDDFTSFRTNDMDSFVINHGDASLEKVETLKAALTSLNKAFEDEVKIPVTSVPMILYGAYRITKDKKSFSTFVEKVKEFLNNYDSNEVYKQFVQSGTGSKENVRGRFDYWREIVRNI